MPSEATKRIFTMELTANHAALILEASEDGEITVNVESPDLEGLAGSICQAIARKLMSDEQFQAEIMELIDNE